MNIDINKYKDMLQPVAKHWFVAVCALFVGYMFFGGDYNVVTILQLQAEENALRRERQVYRDSLQHYQFRLDELETDNVQLEKLAREKMHMRAANEDLYIIDEE